MQAAQQRARDALEPFVLLAATANSPRAVCELVVRATSAKNTYFFAELLQTRNVHALRNAESEHAKYFRLLQIFSYGSWNDYQHHADLPGLNQEQVSKLRQLTLLSQAREPETLGYPELRSCLGLGSECELEELVISAIYDGLIEAKLNPMAQRVEVRSVAPVRDLPPGSIPGMSKVLDAWNQRCCSAIGDLEAEITAIKQRAQLEKRRVEADQRALAKAVETETKSKSSSSGPPATDNLATKSAGKRTVAAETDEMDVDESGQTPGRSLRNAKRGGGTSVSSMKAPKR